MLSYKQKCQAKLVVAIKETKKLVEAAKNCKKAGEAAKDSLEAVYKFALSNRDVVDQAGKTREALNTAFQGAGAYSINECIKMNQRKEEIARQIRHAAEYASAREDL